MLSVGSYFFFFVLSMPLGGRLFSRHSSPSARPLPCRQPAGEADLALQSDRALEASLCAAAVRSHSIFTCGVVVAGASSANDDACGRRSSINWRYRPPFVRLVGAGQDAVRGGLVLGGAPWPPRGQGLPQPDGAPHMKRLLWWLRARESRS